MPKRILIKDCSLLPSCSSTTAIGGSENLVVSCEREAHQVTSAGTVVERSCGAGALVWVVRFVCEIRVCPCVPTRVVCPVCPDSPLPCLSRLHPPGVTRGRRAHTGTRIDTDKPHNHINQSTIKVTHQLQLFLPVIPTVLSTKLNQSDNHVRSRRRRLGLGFLGGRVGWVCRILGR